jgi:hypothetical protein
MTNGRGPPPRRLPVAARVGWNAVEYEALNETFGNRGGSAEQVAAPTPEAIAKTVTDRDASPIGQPELAMITLRLALPRAVLERLRARAIRETRKLEAVIREILEGGAAR